MQTSLSKRFQRNTKQGVLKLMVEHCALAHTAQQGIVIVQTGKCQPEASIKTKKATAE